MTNDMGDGWLGIAPTTRSKRSILVIVLDVDQTMFLRQELWRVNERGAVQRSVRVYGQDEAADTLYIEVRSPLIPLLHLVVQVVL